MVDGHVTLRHINVVFDTVLSELLDRYEMANADPSEVLPIPSSALEELLMSPNRITEALGEDAMLASELS